MTTTTPTRPVTLNLEQKLYVIPCGDGYSCWGFQNAWDETVQLAERLAMNIPDTATFGSLELYQFHRSLVEQAAREEVDLGTWFNRNTDMPVRHALEKARRDKIRVRIWLGDVTTGKSWLEENDTIGTVGRSTGILKIPLLVPARSAGGPAILDQCVIRITDVIRRKELYKHPKFHIPEMVIVKTDYKDAAKKHPFAVLANLEEQAGFKTYAQAAAWLAFMQGEILENPNPSDDE